MCTSTKLDFFILTADIDYVGAKDDRKMHALVYCLLQDHLADKILSQMTLTEAWRAKDVNRQFEGVVANYFSRMRSFDTHLIDGTNAQLVSSLARCFTLP